MNITTHTGLVGFFLALSALHLSGAAAMTYPTAAAATSAPPQTVEGRLARLTAAIRQREALLPEGTTSPAEMLLAIGFANRGGGSGGFANVRGGGGFANGGGGGGFVNVNPWRNAWVNGGGFYNYY